MSVLSEEDCKDDNFGNFKILKEKMLQQEMKQYAEATLRNDILSEDTLINVSMLRIMFL